MKTPSAGSLRIDDFADFIEPFSASLTAEDIHAALSELSRALGALVPEVSVYFGFYRKDAPPIVVDFDGPDEWNRIYPNGYYLLDPGYEMFLKMTQSTCLLPQGVFPKDFRQSEYYLSYYRPYKMIDEVCYLLYMTPNLAAYLSVMRIGEGAKAYSALECKRLAALLPGVERVAQRVWAMHRAKEDEADTFSRDLHRALTKAYDDFGKSLLTEREDEVTRLLLKGLPPKSVGRLLNIAPGTVRNHIKRIYVKLEVRSQAELLAYFFELLSSSAQPPRQVDTTRP